MVDAHPLYMGARPGTDVPPGFVTADGTEVLPICFKVEKPTLPDGTKWDQTNDAANHMRYAATLDLPTLIQAPRPRSGKCIIVGGAPSIKDHLEEIRELSKDPDNYLFAVNWTHTWLLNHGIVPDGLVFFEIDIEPLSVLERAHPDCTYFICCHCDPRTFDHLKGFKRVLWHTPPNSEPEKVVREELFNDTYVVGGGIYTFTRTITVAMFLGYRHFEIFGCDSSYPENGNTHVDGYDTPFKDTTDGMDVWAKNAITGITRKFRTTGTLALQFEEFKSYCQINHAWYSMRVHGDSLLRFAHQNDYPDQYQWNK